MKVKNIIDGIIWIYFVGEKVVVFGVYFFGRGLGDSFLFVIVIFFKDGGNFIIVICFVFRVFGSDCESGCFDCYDFGSAYCGGW